MNNERLLLLGGAGFIGSQIARVFLQHGWRVGIVDGLVEGTGGARAHIVDLESKLEFALFQKIEAIDDLPERVLWADWVVDAMAFTGHLTGFQHPVMDVNSNLLSHLCLLEALKKCPGKRVIYLGSRSQYGAVAANVIMEESPCRPIDPQGINKLAAEHFFRIYSKPYRFDAVSLRLTNCFGPNQSVTGERGLVGGFVQDALDGKTIEIFGSADRAKSLLFGEDAAKIVFGFTRKPWQGFDVFNVGGVESSIREVLEIIFKAAGKGSYTVKPFPEHVKRIDVGEARFSDEKLARFLGDGERTPLSAALPLTVEYFKQNQPRN